MMHTKKKQSEQNKETDKRMAGTASKQCAGAVAAGEIVALKALAL